jgi:hypothetical protein
MRKAILGGLVVGALGLGGCKPSIPKDLRGKYDDSQLMGTDNYTVTVTENSFVIDGCNVNCGYDDKNPPASDGNGGTITMKLTKTKLESDGETTDWTSDDCTGTIERTGGEGGISITANPVPGLSGDAADNRSMRCLLLNGGILTPSS